MKQIKKGDETRKCHDFELKRMERQGWTLAKSKEVVLHKRPKGEWVEGMDRPKTITIESASFPVELLDEALKDGWFKTKDKAMAAPPDKPEGGNK